MTNWKHTLKIKHLMTEEETPEAVSQSMQAIAHVVLGKSFMNDWSGYAECEEIAADSFTCQDLDDANDLLDRLYDYCDSRRIWVK